ncbi:MAG: VanW family protein [Patescibacteria group bacterium]
MAKAGSNLIRKLKTKIKITPSHRLAILTLLAFLVLPFSVNEAKASSPDYGREFGLLVHQGNENLAVPKAKGIQVLESYFYGNPLKASADEAKQFMTQRDFLLGFEKLRMEASGEKTILGDGLLYPLTWLNARRNNWLPDTRLTYKTMREFLYRYSVSQKHGGIPYFEGLVLDKDEINTSNYTSIRQVRDISSNLSGRMSELRRLVRPTKDQKVLLASLVDYAASFEQLENELRAFYHPLNILPDLPEDIRQKITEYDLNEVLDQISYNYSRNNANRIHNLTTGAMQFNGRVFQPDEVINMEQELGRDGWGKYKFGWVLFGGEEAWQFGGGLCGVATITFTPSWRAGLEIIRRFSHSSYYSSLYPEESLGLDATIYRGHKNLIMKNTTDSPLMYYVHNDPEKKEITMYLIGNSPYSDIEIDGPIKTARGTYKWIRRMEHFDGTVDEDELVTRYGLMY